MVIDNICVRSPTPSTTGQPPASHLSVSQSNLRAKPSSRHKPQSPTYLQNRDPHQPPGQPPAFAPVRYLSPTSAQRPSSRHKASKPYVPSKPDLPSLKSSLVSNFAYTPPTHPPAFDTSSRILSKLHSSHTKFQSQMSSIRNKSIRNSSNEPKVAFSTKNPGGTTPRNPSNFGLPLANSYRRSSLLTPSVNSNKTYSSNNNYSRLPYF
ncbi:hypothetical protein Ddc_15085 [Ditylenchus destructor]|nr:hypothetical protein Ddc_15085 [Ditylenchus destructor]